MIFGKDRSDSARILRLSRDGQAFFHAARADLGGLSESVDHGNSDLF
jgi:hypothetical protein